MIKGICNPIFQFLPAQEMILGNGNHSIKVKDTRFQNTPRNLGSKDEVYEPNQQLYDGTILVRPYSCARIVAAAIVSSNGTTFVKAPRYKEAPCDEKRGDEEKKAIYSRHRFRSNIRLHLHLHHHHSHSHHL